MKEDGIEVWRGSVESWECDAMGHMNVGFYIARSVEGLVGLAAALDMPEAFVPAATATLVVREQHVRFLREGLAGAPLSMTAGVLEIGETEARVLLLMRHADGGIAATFDTIVSHATASERRPFPWPERVLARARDLMVTAPPEAAPRGLGPRTGAAPQASLARADALGLRVIGGGAMRPQDCDVFGRMRPDAMMFRLSASAAHLFAPVRAALSERGRSMGGAIVEYRLVYIDPPGAGRRFVLRSGLVGGDARARRLVHWMLDPDSGRAYGAAEAMLVGLDLKARKLLDLDEADLTVMKAHMIPGLTL